MQKDLSKGSPSTYIVIRNIRAEDGTGSLCKSEIFANYLVYVNFVDYLRQASLLIRS